MTWVTPPELDDVPPTELLPAPTDDDIKTPEEPAALEEALAADEEACRDDVVPPLLGPLDARELDPRELDPAALEPPPLEDTTPPLLDDDDDVDVLPSGSGRGHPSNATRPNTPHSFIRIGTPKNKAWLS